MLPSRLCVALPKITKNVGMPCNHSVGSRLPTIKELSRLQVSSIINIACIHLGNAFACLKLTINKGYSDMKRECNWNLICWRRICTKAVVPGRIGGVRRPRLGHKYNWPWGCSWSCSRFAKGDWGVCMQWLQWTPWKTFLFNIYRRITMCNWSTHFPKMCDKLYIYIPHRRNED